MFFESLNFCACSKNMWRDMQQFLHAKSKEYQQKLVKSGAAWAEWQSTFSEFNLHLICLGT
jgi:hypothetical protein